MTLREPALVLMLGVLAGCAGEPIASDGSLLLPAVDALPGGSLPPVAGGTLLVTSRGLVVAADPDHATVWVLDPAAERLVGRVSLNAGDEPGRLVEDDAGDVHVVLRGADQLLSLRLDDGVEVLGRRQTCVAPRGVAWDASAESLWVACATGGLWALPREGEADRRFVVERDLRDVVATDAGLFVSRFRAAELLTIDRDGGAVLARRRPMTNRVPSPTTGQQLAATVAWRIRAMDDGGVLMLHQRSVASEIDVDRDGYFELFCRNGVVSPALTKFPASGDDVVSSGPVGFAPMPLDVAVMADGRRVVALSASPDDGLQGVWSTVEVPDEPERTYPCAPLVFPTRGGLPAVAVAELDGRLVTQHRDPTRIVVHGGPTFAMADAIDGDDGHALFHTGTARFVACASCHPDGGEDGHTWSFTGIGLRRTQTLRGGLLSTAPFHWSGDEPDMTSIMTGGFQRRMGGRDLAPGEIETISEWLDALPPLGAAERDEATSAAIERGRAIYDSPEVGCASCHAALTGANVDVGTGEPYQVPSLRGVVDRAPYFHDGCAPSLAAVVDGACGTLDRHGITSSLSAAERADLVAFLDSL